MFRFLKSDPEKKLKKKYRKLLERALDFQRNGNIRMYSELSFQADQVLKEINALKNKQQPPTE